MIGKSKYSLETFEDLKIFLDEMQSLQAQDLKNKKTVVYFDQTNDTSDTGLKNFMSLLVALKVAKNKGAEICGLNLGEQENQTYIGNWYFLLQIQCLRLILICLRLCFQKKTSNMSPLMNLLFYK